MIARSQFFTTVFALAGLLLQGCTTMGYYSSAVAGQTELFLKQAPISELLEEDTLEARTREKLLLAQSLRQYSTEQLGLPDNDSYSTYADLERRYVVWTVFAAAEFSIEPKQFCFLVVGCLHYRGHFSEDAARREQKRLQQQGYDVFVGGVAAYSTLGWFDDPVLNTMLHWSDTYFARVLFHELAHQQLYVKGDTTFNESFAETVALIGVQRWLTDSGNIEQVKHFQAEIDHDQQFVELVMYYRQQLQDLYDSGISETAMRSGKKQLFDAMRLDYEALKTSELQGTYDSWFQQDLNNAKLASVSTYRKFTRDMLAIYADLGNNLPLFYDIMASFGRCTAEQRGELLENRRLSADC